jgi:hypothetical protein
MPPHHVRRQDPVPWVPGHRPHPVTDPTLVYPWSLMWHQANRHPSLPLLIAYVKARYQRPRDARSQWLPVPDRPLFPPDPQPGS